MLFSRVCLGQGKFWYKIAKMSTQSAREVLKPPNAVRHMKTLDKSLFAKSINVPFVQVETKSVSKIIRTLKKYLLKLERFRPVQEVQKVDEDVVGGATIVILDPTKVQKFEDVEATDRKTLSENGIGQDDFAHRNIQLQFDNYSVEEILRAVLPTETEGMASFTKIGHIVHVNLRDHLLPYKTIIGAVLVDKVAACRTVVNKIDTIDNTYRNFKMEVLAGDEDFMVQLKENRCTFEFDFATVYWNSRLCTEHERIVKTIRKEDVLFDVFAGVGPFAIPASKRGALVWANDLNPESYKWLQHNAKLNKIGDNLHVYNKDGKDFILSDIKRELIGQLRLNKVIHITMNLPAMASEFLKYFQGLYSSEELDGVANFPLVYLYCFAKGEDTDNITRKLIDECMGRDMTPFVKELFKVRTVSNFKEMMRVTIRLEREILELQSDENKKRSIEHDETRNEPKKCTIIKCRLFLYQHRS